jgi:hypothetical protein
MTITDITAGDLIARAIAVVDDDIARLTATRAQLIAARESLTGVAAATVPASRATGATPPAQLRSVPTGNASTKSAAPTKKPTKPVARRAASNPTPPDYEKIAEVMRSARRGGLPVQPTLAVEFDVPLTTVKNWITKVYQLGLVERPTPETSTPTNRPAPAVVTAAIDAVTAAEHDLAAL